MASNVISNNSNNNSIVTTDQTSTMTVTSQPQPTTIPRAAATSSINQRNNVSNRGNNNDVDMEGWLHKWTNYIKGYQKRWFVLSKGLLSYYRNPSDMSHTCRGNISIGNALIHTEDSCHFLVSNGGTQTFHLRASNEIERQKWVTALELAKTRLHVDSEDEEDMVIVSNKDSFSSDKSDLNVLLKNLSSKLEDLKTCHDLNVKRSTSLHQVLTELANCNEPNDAISKMKLLNERSTLFRITSSAMMKTSSEFLTMSTNYSRKLNKLLKKEHDAKLRLEEMIEQLAKQHSHLEAAAKAASPKSGHGAQGGGGTSGATGATNSDDEEFFDAEETAADFFVSFPGRACRVSISSSDRKLEKSDNNNGATSDKGQTCGLLNSASSKLPELSKTPDETCPDTPPIPPTRLKVRKQKSRRRSSTKKPVVQITPLEQQISLTETASTSSTTSTTTTDDDDVTKTNATDEDNDEEYYSSASDDEVMLVCSKNSSDAKNDLRPQDSTEDQRRSKMEEVGVIRSRNSSKKLSKNKMLTKLEQSSKSSIDEPKIRGNSITFDGRVRRSRIPEKPSHSLNLWSFMKNCIGKELTKIPMPVNFNEPLSMLQRVTEDFEYADLLHRAAKLTDACEQLVYVAAFCVSHYANSALRTGKPFNPLLGETFECDRRSDLGWRSITEQVTGVVVNSNGDAEWVLNGTWDGKMEASKVINTQESKGKPRVLETSTPKLIWKKSPLHNDSEKMYNLTLLAIQLNEPEDGIAPTDSRLRPDQRLMENGRWDEANRVKQALEEKQRQVRRQREQEAESATMLGRPHQQYEPIWFERTKDAITGNPIYMFRGNYWDYKDRQEWSMCPDIYNVEGFLSENDSNTITPSSSPSHKESSSASANTNRDLAIGTAATMLAYTLAKND